LFVSGENRSKELEKSSHKAKISPQNCPKVKKHKNLQKFDHFGCKKTSLSFDPVLGNGRFLSVYEESVVKTFSEI
jgi:hypothetical protein